MPFMWYADINKASVEVPRCVPTDVGFNVDAPSFVPESSGSAEVSDEAQEAHQYILWLPHASRLFIQADYTTWQELE